MDFLTYRSRLLKPLRLGMLISISVIGASAQALVGVPRDDTQIWPEVQITMPLSKRVDLIVGGQVRIGRNVSDFVDERGGMGLVFKVHRNLTLSPSYLHIATQPTHHLNAFENRLNFAATVQLPLGRFMVTDRNLFERRFRGPLDSTRYRNRFQIAHPLKLLGAEVTAFLSDEVFYDWSQNGWTRNRLSAGITRRLAKNVTLDLYYMRQMDGRARPGDLNAVGSLFRIRL